MKLSAVERSAGKVGEGRSQGFYQAALPQGFEPQSGLDLNKKLNSLKLWLVKSVYAPVKIKEINYVTHFLPKIDPAAKGKELIQYLDRPNPSEEHYPMVLQGIKDKVEQQINLFDQLRRLHTGYRLNRVTSISLVEAYAKIEDQLLLWTETEQMSQFLQRREIIRLLEAELVKAQRSSPPIEMSSSTGSSPAPFKPSEPRGSVCSIVMHNKLRLALCEELLRLDEQSRVMVNAGQRSCACDWLCWYVATGTRRGKRCALFCVLRLDDQQRCPVDWLSSFCILKQRLVVQLREIVRYCSLQLVVITVVSDWICLAWLEISSAVGSCVCWFGKLFVSTGFVGGQLFELIPVVAFTRVFGILAGLVVAQFKATQVLQLVVVSTQLVVPQEVASVSQ
ncbi:hypothetical protein F511_31246 [Dorcoceras hygrometricum]|uniref:Uncharacterized protein n=1 Tax=Dorcoceras hygrometricum TaxID=472368 RepID=A0A2Z7B2J3_9LAMI|nr:hypothetical protein F511_31246 [Dorcoceras hygrometricum]